MYAINHYPILIQPIKIDGLDKLNTSAQIMVWTIISHNKEYYNSHILV